MDDFREYRPAVSLELRPDLDLKCLWSLGSTTPPSLSKLRFWRRLPAYFNSCCCSNLNSLNGEKETYLSVKPKQLCRPSWNCSGWTKALSKTTLRQHDTTGIQGFPHSWFKQHSECWGRHTDVVLKIPQRKEREKSEANELSATYQHFFLDFFEPHHPRYCRPPAPAPTL